MFLHDLSWSIGSQCSDIYVYIIHVYSPRGYKLDGVWRMSTLIDGLSEILGRGRRVTDSGRESRDCVMTEGPALLVTRE